MWSKKASEKHIAISSPFNETALWGFKHENQNDLGSALLVLHITQKQGKIDTGNVQLFPQKQKKLLSLHSGGDKTILWITLINRSGSRVPTLLQEICGTTQNMELDVRFDIQEAPKKVEEEEEE